MRRTHKSHKAAKRTQGFALVTALLLMILLTIVSVSMLSLAAVVLRNSTTQQAGAVARANARLALAQAISELQITMGPDQRISASAMVVSPQPAQPRLTGAWKSWHWNPSGTPPSYSEKKSNFLRWLVSASPSHSQNLDFPNQPPAGETIELVSDRKDSEGLSTQLSAGKIQVISTDRKNTGAYAWAVFDESTKAAVDLTDPPNVMDIAQELASRTAPSRPRADTIDPEKLAQLRQPGRFITLETATIPGKPANHSELRRRFHDLTTGTLGLLTNTASGGVKLDLSALLAP